MQDRKADMGAGSNKTNRAISRPVKNDREPTTPLIRDAIVQAAIEAGDGDMVTGCTFTDTRAEIRLGSRSVIEISMDENDLSGSEFFAVDDVDDAAFVVN